MEECFQRLFQVQKVLEARRNGWVKLHEDIDVAFIFLEVPALNWAERFQPPDSMEQAEPRNSVTIVLDDRMHACVELQLRLAILAYHSMVGDVD